MRTGLIPDVVVIDIRTGLIPDVVVIDIRPFGTRVKAKNLVLAAKVWSPGNTRKERESKIIACANAGVPYFWALHQDRFGDVRSRCAEPVTSNGPRLATVRVERED